MWPSYGRSLNVYLLDDHDIVRQGLRDLLAPARDVFVVGDTESAQTAVNSILRLGADVMVLDLRLQDGSGVQVCRRVRAQEPSVQGLLLTSADDDEALAAALLAGAAGVVVKLARSSNVLDAIRRVGAGRPMIDEALASKTGNMLRARAQAMSPPLTDQQMQVLDHVLAGRTDPEVGQAMGLDPERARREVAVVVERLLAPGDGG